MANAVSICNLALSFIGDSATVASIDPPEESVQAKMCAVQYPAALSALLEMHDWSFAKRRIQVAKQSGVPTFGWAGAYPVPSDCLHVISIESITPINGFFGIYTNSRRVVTDCSEFELGMTDTGLVLYTDLVNPVIQYTTSRVDEARFTPDFVMALAWYLASLLAGQRIKGKEGQTLARTCQDQFRIALSIAKTRDASQQNMRIDFVPTWIWRR